MSCEKINIPKCLFIILLTIGNFGISSSFVLRAYISQHGLHGEIEFSRTNDSIVSIRTNLNPTLQYPDQIWRWSIHEFPVDYRDLSESRCSESNLGKEVIDLTDELGYLVIPGKDHVEFESKNQLTGPNGFWGKSIVFRTAEHNRVICASIISADRSFEKVAAARFTSPIAGILYFRWIAAKEFDESDSYIESDLYHTRAVSVKSEFTTHKWKVFVTDIFDPRQTSFEENCNVLQTVFDPESRGDGQSLGDLDNRLGGIKVATEAKLKRVKTLYKDVGLNVLPGDMEVTKRHLYVVIFDEKHPDSFLACAKVRYVQPGYAKAFIDMDGVRGQVDFTQHSPFEPTWANFTISSSDMDYENSLRFVSSVATYQINDLPQKLYTADQIKTICNTTGNMYNPMNIESKLIPPPGLGTQDQYPVGDVLGKYKDRTEYLNHKYLLPGLSNELSGLYWDLFLPLWGPHSVMHRSVVITRRDKRPALCGIIHRYEYGTEYQTPMANAEVIFRYPLVGKIIFRQPSERYWEDTTIIIENLIHADGSNTNNTFEHRWAVHENPPGVDFYNWTARCLSAGGMYDPHKVDIDTRHPEDYCKFGLEGLCRIGDLTTRHHTLTVAGKKRDSIRLTRRLFTDSVIPLSGHSSILRKSLVIYDDHGPLARGERMACSLVGGLHRRKGVVREWFGNGQAVALAGRLELLQQGEYDLTNVQVDLDGLSDINSYRIHLAPVEPELEFPCENSTLYDTYNPFHINKHETLPPTKGSADQYELGDLAGKYGTLEGHRKVSTHFNETQLTLFGPFSVLGRSLILHKQRKNRRWACSTIERGYSPSEAREIRAIASFHHPGGFAYGYVRMTQLIYNDGSQSDTIIEVKLRHPGVRDRNVTYDHNWAIYVNPVGVDAAVQVPDTRCVAGGYRWNPYFTQLADPLNQDLYNEECGADNPLRCHVGDVSARLGPINIGTERQMFVDSNFPLEGVVSAVGRSLVVLGPGFSSQRFACANIQPDKDIIKYANIRKPPRFIITQFMEEVREVMGVPEWMVAVDARRTQALHGNTCVRFLLHFKGPHANQLELDFARLMDTGRLDSPSIFIPGYINTKRKSTLAYRQCGAVDPNENKKSRSPFSLSAFSFSGARNGNIIDTYSYIYCIVIFFFAQFL